MSYKIRIISKELNDLVSFIETNVLPIKYPLPFKINGTEAVYDIDVENMEPKTKNNLINYCAEKLGSSFEFAKDRLKTHMFPVYTKHAIMYRLDMYQVYLLRKAYDDESKNKFGDDFYNNNITKCYWTSLMIIIFLLGDSWKNRNLQINPNDNINKTQYFRYGHFKSKKERTVHFFRFILFADALFNLQNVKNFHKKLDKIRNYNLEYHEQHLEDFIIELHISNMILKNNKKIEFGQKTGRKGEDFDLKLICEDNENIYCEFKCKRENTNYKKRNLRRTINNADHQITNNNKKIIFIRIPTSWPKLDEFTKDVDSLVKHIFIKKNHINAIIFIWDEVELTQNNLWQAVVKFKFYNNENSRHPIDLNDILNPKVFPIKTKIDSFETSFGEF